jgi:hypothetical protein
VKQKIDKLSQVLLPILTVFGFLLVSLKMPQYGLPIQLASQLVWLYSGYQAWKKAGQIGIFVTSLIVTVIVLFGIINYWFF